MRSGAQAACSGKARAYNPDEVPVVGAEEGDGVKLEAVDDALPVSGGPTSMTTTNGSGSAVIVGLDDDLGF